MYLRSTFMLLLHDSWVFGGAWYNHNNYVRWVQSKRNFTLAFPPETGTQQIQLPSQIRSAEKKRQYLTEKKEFELCKLEVHE